MFLKTNHYIDTLPVAIVIREKTKHRLAGTCFRGTNKYLAGNFFAFKSAWEVFDLNGHFPLSFLREVEEKYFDSEKTASYSFDCGRLVGWSGTDSLFAYDDSEMEEFQPNRRSDGFRIKTDRLDLLAPLTSIITVVYEIRLEDDKIVVVIHSIYPGKDIGELDGNVSQREGVVFFDWNHPGEPL